VEVIKAMIEFDSKTANLTNSSGDTFIHVAASEGYANIVEVYQIYCLFRDVSNVLIS
jgi:hypothetical protein